MLDRDFHIEMNKCCFSERVAVRACKLALETESLGKPPRPQFVLTSSGDLVSTQITDEARNRILNNVRAALDIMTEEQER